MRKILIFLHILQVKSNNGRVPVLGRGFQEAYRINPFNPLSYAALIIIPFIGIIMFGVVGFWKEVDLKNPFLWY